MAAKSVFTGIDYLRLTAQDHEPYAPWAAIMLPEWLADEQAGKKPQWRWMLGYYGRATEHSFLGKSDAGTMLQLSGALAWHRWYDAGNHSKKCTRIDLQVTWPIEEQPGDYIREQYQQGRAAPHGRGKPPELTLTDTPRGAKMLTVGARQSELYGRMYDKFRESKLKEYEGCVRWEIECKGQTAYDLHAYMRENKFEPGVTRAVVKDFWERRGMTPFWDTYEAYEGVPPVKRSKTDDSKLAWLAAQVAPTVRKLYANNRSPDVIRAIFGQHLTDSDVAAIVFITENDGRD